MKDLKLILSAVYGTSVFASDPIAIIWAADKIKDIDEAKKQLREANDMREKNGLVTIYPGYGHRLF